MLEDLAGVVLGLDFLTAEDALDAVVGVDDEGRTLGAHVLAPVHTLLDPRAEELVELDIGIGDQAEGQGVPRAEALVALGGVTADTDDLIARFAQLGIAVAQTTGLSGAARGIVLGIEVEDDLLAWVLGEAHLLPVLV